MHEARWVLRTRWQAPVRAWAKNDEGGDRQANAGLHRIVFTRLRFESPHTGSIRTPHPGGQDPT